MSLLDKINIRNYLPSSDYTGDTQWSLIFNSQKLTIDVVINRNYEQVYTYSVK